MNPGDTVRERYRLESTLGEGGDGSSWLARDLQDLTPVVLRALPLSALRTWGDLESLERDAEVLASIRHPCVPRLVESFTMGEGGDSVYVVVRRYVPGKSLDQSVREGWRATEEQIREVAVGLLDVVEHIHGLRPPVIHRNINPRNVIVGEDGGVHLVGFGSVRDPPRSGGAAEMSAGGSSGYAPLEQWSGDATERTDLYACGATLLYLLTHTNPADLPATGGRVDFRAVVEVSPALGYVLDRLLEPDEARRALAPGRAIATLRSGEVPGGAVTRPYPPYGSRIRVSRTASMVILEIPERGNLVSGLSILGFSSFWLVFVAAWTAMSLAMGAPFFFPLFSLPFWVVGIAMLRRSLRGLIGRVKISLSSAGLLLVRRILFSGRPASLPLDALGTVTVARGTGRQASAPRSGSGAAPEAVRIEAGARTLAFGELLSDAEKKWIADTIGGEIERLRG